MKRGAFGLGLAGLVVVAAVVGLVPSLRSAFMDNVLNVSGSASSPPGETADLCLISGDSGELEVGDTAPNFRLETVDGTVVELADYRGEKNVILNFWATWCPPCKAEMADFEDAYRAHSDELVVLGVDLMESKQDVRTFLADEVDVSYPILIDPSGEVARGYRLFTQPTTYFIDKQGRIARIGNQAVKNGAFTPEELDRRVESLLSDDASAIETHGSTGAPSSASVKRAGFSTGDLTGAYFTERQVRQMGFDVDPRNVRYADWVNPDEIRSGGPAPDGIPSIDAPDFQSVRSASQWLEPDDIVLGVEHNGEAKAYPIRILNWHEIVNDAIGGTRIAATYCPLCGSGVVFVRPERNGTQAEFGTSGRLYNSDLVMYDRVTGTFWSQIDGSPMVGPLVGEVEELDRLPNSMARWEGWKAAHPEGQVLARPTTTTAMGGNPPRTDDPDAARQIRDYDRNPYSGYADRESLMFPVSQTDDRLGNKELVSGVTLQDQAKAYRKSAVEDVGVLNDFVGGVPVLVAWHPKLDDVVVFERKTGERPQPLEFKVDNGELVETTTDSTWGWNGQAQSGRLADTRLARITSTTTFWFAWAAFHPDTELFNPGASTPEHPTKSDDSESGGTSVDAQFQTGDLGWKYLTGHQIEQMGFNVDPKNVRYADWVDPRKLRSGGVPPDGIPSIDGPQFESVQSASEWLQPDDLVMTIERDDETKAYPVRIMNYHEIVNDTIAGVPIAMTYCPLCHSGVVFKRPELNGKVAEFGTTGRLYNSDLVMYDRVTGTFWSQIEGTPMIGPLVAEFGALERLPSNMARWEAWKQHHPDAQVLARPTEATALGGQPPQTSDSEKAHLMRDYSQHPYADYASSDHGTFGTLASDRRLVPKARIAGIRVEGSAKAYRKSAVKLRRVIHDVVSGVAILVVWNPEADDVAVFDRSSAGYPEPLEFDRQDDRLVDRQTGTTWSWDGRSRSGPLADEAAQLNRIISATMYWFAWAAFYPDTSLYDPETLSPELQTDSSGN